MRPFFCLRWCHAAGVALVALTALAMLGTSPSVTSAFPPQVVPQKPPPPPITAKSYLQELVNWCKQSKPGWSPNTVHLVMVSNRPDPQQNATYTEGYLSVSGTNQLQTTVTNGTVSDTVYYNNKRYNCPPGGFPVNPFDASPGSVQHLKITLDATTGKATIGLLNTFNLTYSQGVLYGQNRFGEMYVITLKKVPGQPFPP
jgi:hypothetical protein